MTETKRSSRPVVLAVLLGAAVIALALLALRQNATLKQQEQRIQDLTAAVATNAQRAAFELQERCAQHAKNAFGTLGQGGEFAAYASHYNVRLNRCFVEIESHDTKTSPGTTFINRTLMDAVEGFVYGDYAAKSLDPVPFVCSMRPSRNVEQTCKSSAEFAEFSKKYMEDH